MSNPGGPVQPNAPASAAPEKPAVTAETPIVDVSTTKSAAERFHAELNSDTSAEGPGTHDALPGVFINRADRPAVSSKPAAASAPAAPAPTDPGAAGVVASAGAASSPAAPAAAPKFKLGDLEWESEQAAVHSIKTLRGMHRSMQQEKEARDKQLIALQQELIKAAGRRAEVPQEGASTASPKGQPQGGPAASDDAVNWEVFQLLKEKHGADVAQQWYDQETQARTNRIVEERVKAAVAELEKKVAPALTLVQERQKRAHISSLITQMRAYQNPDGSPAYPELAEENAAELAKVRETWEAIGMPREILYTPRGLHTAIATYRDTMARQARFSAQAPQPSLALPDTSVASGVLSVAGERPATHQLTPPPSEDIGDRITRASLRFDEKLGFSLNR